jgi:hypothetical protein
LSFFLTILLKNIGRKTLELTNKQASTPARSWNNIEERRHLPEVDCYAELNTWVQRAILEAEENKDFNKKNQFLILLKYL